MTRQDLVDELAALLDVAPVGDRLFRGARKRGGVGRVYGGQVVAQALAAASKTVDPARQIHSLHSYFLRGGSEDHEIEYRVEADFDGGSFSNRRVVASQQGRVIFNLAASFHLREAGRAHQPTMPDVPMPEELLNIPDYLAQHPEYKPKISNRVFLDPSPIEVRCVGIPPFCEQAPTEPQLSLWFRTVAPVPGEQWMHRAFAAYASDFAMITTALRPHGDFDLQAASIDHSLWFHEDIDVEDWLLYTTNSPWAGGARGLSLGQIFDRSGRLVASVAQEGLMRDRGMK
ncbi:MAG: acyl-CoA thioesterase [Sphingobium sp.]